VVLQEIYFDGLFTAWLSNRKQRVQMHRIFSDWTQVTSGVLQGSVLGPVLFLIYINDLEAGISNSSRVLKFADDTKLYRKVDSSNDQTLLQRDLDSLCRWAGDWQMSFNVSKCKLMHVGKRNQSFDYVMEGQSLEKSSTEKDLSVFLSCDLKSASHCINANVKGNKMLGLVKRTVESRDPQVLLALYKSLVRPHLEYCCSAWNPHYTKDKHLLEKYNIVLPICFQI